MKQLFISLSMICCLILFSFGCSEENITEPTGGNLLQQFGNSNVPGDFGVTTSIVIFANPVVNQGTTGNVEMGTVKEGLSVHLENESPVYTDANGVAVIKNVPVKNNLPVYVENDIVYVDVLAEYDQYDVILKYKNDQAEIVDEPIRRQFVENIEMADTLYSLSDQLRENDLIILLDTLVYGDDVEIRGNNLCIIGTGIAPHSIIEGNVTVYGNNICIVDVIINGNLIVKGNNFEISYSKFNNMDIEREDVVVLKNQVNGSANVSAERVYLLDKANLP
jgi:hypothetical protein